MSEVAETTREIVEHILTDRQVSEEVTISQFRDVYNQVSGSEVGAGLTWIVVITGDRAIAQPLGRSDISLFIGETKSRYYVRKDFEFLPAGRAALLGSLDGKYGFLSFVKDVFGVRRSLVVLLGTVLVGVATFRGVIPIEVNRKVADALISSLAIFITIFVLFVLTVDTKDAAPMLQSGRYRKMTQSDKYIALIGLTALTVVAASSGILAAPTTGLGWRVGQAVSFGIGAALTFTSFWLVVAYHFSRRHEMTEILMAKHLLERVQDDWTVAQPRGPRSTA